MTQRIGQFLYSLLCGVVFAAIAWAFIVAFFLMMG